jgi:DNA-binding LacI/PurR family transcriptional regulator
MELRDKEQLKTEILQTWLRSAWVYPVQSPDGDRTFLRLTPGGRLKMRRRIGELEGALGVKGDDVARQDEAGTLPVVAVNQVEGARLATRHLLDLGHSTVRHVAGPSDWLEAEGRVRGWRDILEEAGAPVPKLLHGDWSPRSGYEAGRQLAETARRRTGHPFDAVFVANDQMALGMLRAFGEAGIRVPDDVSLVGFDDIPEAEFFSPPLSTVRQDFTEVGRRSIDMLLAEIENGAHRGDGRQAIVPPELVVRASSGPAHGPE